MTTFKVAWIYEAHDSPRFHLGRDERFIDEVARYAGVSISRIEGRLQEVAPRDGFMLLNSFGPAHSLSSCDPDRRQDLASRMIAVDVSDSRIFERVLEPLSIAGAIDALSHLAWQEQSAGSGSAQYLYGLSDVARKLNANCEGAGSKRYCRMLSESAGGLPELLARYLVALHASRVGAPTG